MKKLGFILLALALAVAALMFLPRRAGPGGDTVTLLDILFRKPDTLLARIDRARDSLALEIRSVDSMYRYRDDTTAARLRATEAALQTAQARARAANRRSDSLTAALAGADDDDSLVVQTAVIAGLRVELVDTRAERDAALGLVGALASDTLRLHDELAQVREHLGRSLRLNQQYRNRNSPKWLTTGLVIAGTIAGCKLFEGEQNPC